MKWYIMVVKAGSDKENVYQQFEVVKVGPFTKLQLPDILAKFSYKIGGAIRIYQARY